MIELVNIGKPAFGRRVHLNQRHCWQVFTVPLPLAVPQSIAARKVCKRAKVWKGVGKGQNVKGSVKGSVKARKVCKRAEKNLRWLVLGLSGVQRRGL